MIERNIGQSERVIRFALGVLIVGWILTGRNFGLGEGLALVIAFALFWNSIFARCYLWKWLRISSCSPGAKDCGGDGRSGA